ncbi:MAG TPA: SUMF1/EgtB/PvdO family nonheme iron enzyme [Polyangiaceae bacterium]|nr:SUMF1/EgtB/PvdO family nonheme iron enzyme [Polyangiaceae bacterium]
MRWNTAGRVLWLVACFPGCREATVTQTEPSARPSAATTALAAPPGSAAGSARTDAGGTGPNAASCPAGMALIPGGKFWVGSSARERFADDERPKFLTELAPFCMDVTEVLAGPYAECVQQGRCERPKPTRRSCTFGRAGREQHPINCVTFEQARAYCAARGARLPSEVEWEFAARGGPEYRRYPWGSAGPDGHTCWKHNGTCRSKEFEAGAFGLYDVSGNVWEWTDTWYGPYPFPPERGFAKVYRGGSFSRRFEKWMHTRLRNRALPGDEGSHLGFRCALNPVGVSCPDGKDAQGHCLHVVLDAECEAGQLWNGVRCARAGAPRCPAGLVEQAGFGCVVPTLDEPAPGPSSEKRKTESADSSSSEARAEKRRQKEKEAATLAEVRRSRSPEFDSDCRLNQPSRPHAYRYVAGTHAARTQAGKTAGCRNRDVGVGWNSACCP